MEKHTTDAQARALVKAGALLQGAGVKIKPEGGEKYPQAVAREIARLSEAERSALRAQVRWVLDYEGEELASSQSSRPGES